MRPDHRPTSTSRTHRAWSAVALLILSALRAVVALAVGQADESERGPVTGAGGLRTQTATRAGRNGDAGRTGDASPRRVSPRFGRRRVSSRLRYASDRGH